MVIKHQVKKRLPRLGGFHTDYVSELLEIIKNEKPTFGWLFENSPISYKKGFLGYIRYFKEKKLVEIIASKYDKRIGHYFITDKGKQLLRLLP